jgi:hypothetical protein
VERGGGGGRSRGARCRGAGRNGGAGTDVGGGYLAVDTGLKFKHFQILIHSGDYWVANSSVA